MVKFDGEDPEEYKYMSPALKKQLKDIELSKLKEQYEQNREYRETKSDKDKMELDLGKNQFVDVSGGNQKHYSASQNYKKFEQFWKTRQKIYLQLMRDPANVNEYDDRIKKHINKTIMKTKNNFFEEVIGPLQGIYPDCSTHKNFITKEIFVKAILTKILKSKKKSNLAELNQEQKKLDEETKKLFNDDKIKKKDHF